MGGGVAGGWAGVGYGVGSPEGARPSFQVIPAVDVLGEEAVRLVQGRFDRVSVRGGNPATLAARFAEQGATLIHVVDLDGARNGRVRRDLVARIAEAARPASIQASGGIRSPADAASLIEAGATRVVVGTAAFAEPAALQMFATALADRLVVALDASGGRIAVAGWEREAGLSVEEAAERCADAGVARVLCTAIQRDGTLSGPDLELLGSVRAASGVHVLAAGGIGTRADLDAVAAIGCEGAVVGRALLEGALSLDD
jgi:phosphoribosylformimino-5-aminoimidazole carboxamide ribotide isomerase